MKEKIINKENFDNIFNNAFNSMHKKYAGIMTSSDLQTLAKFKNFLEEEIFKNN